MSEHNASGISSYCLRTLEWLGPEFLEDVDLSRPSRVIAERAEGVFLWARFALYEVIQGHSSGENFKELLVRLQSTPLELEDVYDRMLSRIEPIAKAGKYDHAAACVLCKGSTVLAGASCGY